MRNIFKILLGAGIVLSLAGCQKGTSHGDLDGKVIRFNAKSGSVSTRTAFSGDGTVTTAEKKEDEFGRKILTHERINWEIGDAILIASDNATIYGDPTTKYATYTVAKVTANGDISEAELDEKAGSEELFFNENETYKFWGIYPASAGNGEDLVNAKANYTISGSQASTGTPTTTSVTVGDVTKNLTVLPADMTQAVVLAAAENQTKESVVLQFYPGFTAFEFTLNSAGGDLVLKKLVLTTANESNSSAGDVAVSEIKPEGATFSNTANYDVTYPSEKALTFEFPENTTITTTDYLTFTVFALPETIEGMTLEFHMGEDGNIVQKADLKKNGEIVSFAGCKKHSLRGVAVRGGWAFELDGEVLDWEYLEKETDFTEQVQSSAFEDHYATPMRLIVGADETKTGTDSNNYVAMDPVDKTYTPATYAEFIAKSAADQAQYLVDHPTYQYRYFQNRTLLPTADYFQFSFQPSAPRAGYWMFEPQGDVDMFEIATWDIDKETWIDLDMGDIHGQIMNQMITFRLKPSANVPTTRTQPYAIYFKAYFSSNINFEPALSADSEVQDVHGAGDFSYWHFVIPANN